MDLPYADAGNAVLTERISLLSRQLLVCATATDCLAAWCETHGIGDGPIRTKVSQGAVSSSNAGAVGYRRVKLLRGAAFLSAAEIRYRCDALDPAILRNLAETDIPFGKLVAPLNPRRITTFVGTFGELSAECVLVHHATVLDGSGRPIARVREAYQRVLVSLRPDDSRLS